jgi:hypothetical protein
MSKGGGVEIPSDYTFKIGSDGSTITVDSDLDNIHIKEIAPVTVNANVAVTQPIVTQSTSTSDAKATVGLKLEPLDIKIEPLQITSDSKSEIDLKPVAVDSCQTLKFAPLPPIHMEQPYSQHFGVTFMGMELWGFNVSGRSETFLHSPSKTHHYGPEHHQCGGEPEPKVKPSGPSPSRGGLRVRVK